MKSLTLWQPWASLIAVGQKSIETRGWSTTYRGPLLIHASKRKPDDLSPIDPIDPIFTALEAAGVDPRAVASWSGAEWYEQGIDSPRTWGKPMPLGAVVATCTLADVVPMIGLGDYPPREGGWLSVGRHAVLLRESVGAGDRTGQMPYGLFEPGRYAWLLADVRPLTSPVPARGCQGLWTPDADLVAAVEAAR